MCIRDRVIPARLFGVKKDTGAKIEILLLKRGENDIWETLVRPGKKEMCIRDRRKTGQGFPALVRFPENGDSVGGSSPR